MVVLSPIGNTRTRLRTYTYAAATDRQTDRHGHHTQHTDACVVVFLWQKKMVNILVYVYLSCLLVHIYCIVYSCGCNQSKLISVILGNFSARFHFSDLNILYLEFLVLFSSLLLRCCCCSWRLMCACVKETNSCFCQIHTIERERRWLA